LHLGQNDLPLKIARKWLGHNKILGVSATTLEEAVVAEGEGADYLGVGPIYEARITKSDAGEPLGLSLLQQIRKKCKIPLVAIGGIQLENVKEVFHAGADAVAIISAILTSENIRLATEVMKKAITQVFNK
jgi:thiamine-phosphate diphosphorylase